MNGQFHLSWQDNLGCRLLGNDYQHNSTELVQCFPGSSGVKNPAANTGDSEDVVGSIPGSGRSPREESSNSLQDSCLKNLMGREVWKAAVLRVAGSDMIWVTEQASIMLAKGEGSLEWGREGRWSVLTLAPRATAAASIIIVQVDNPVEVYLGGYNWMLVSRMRHNNFSFREEVRASCSCMRFGYSEEWEQIWEVRGVNYTRPILCWSLFPQHFLSPGSQVSPGFPAWAATVIAPTDSAVHFIF